MAATVIDELIVRIGLSADTFSAEQKRVLEELERVRQAGTRTSRDVQTGFDRGVDSLAAMQKGALRLAAVFLGGMGLQQFVENMTKMTAAAGRLSVQLGVSVEDLSKWENAGKLVGASGGEIASSMERLTSSIYQFQITGQSALIPYFNTMGIALRDSTGKVRALNDILMDMSRWAQGKDAAFVTEWFKQMGMSSGMINTLIQGPEKLAKNLKEMSQYAPTPAQVQRFQELQEAMARLAASSEAAGRSIVDHFTPALTKVLNLATEVTTALSEMMNAPEEKGPKKDAVGPADKWSGAIGHGIDVLQKRGWISQESADSARRLLEHRRSSELDAELERNIGGYHQRENLRETNRARGLGALPQEDAVRRGTEEGSKKGIIEGIMGLFHRTSYTPQSTYGGAQVMQASYQPGGSGGYGSAGPEGGSSGRRGRIPGASNEGGVGPGYTGDLSQTSNAFLAEQRAPFARELDDADTRRLLGAVISAENVGAGPGVAESLMNRTALVNEARARRGLPPLTLRDMMLGHPSIDRGRSFYGPIRNGAIRAHLAKMNDPRFAAQMNKRIDQALAGSNVVKGYTDQGSPGDPNYAAGGTGVNINGERFNDWSYPGAASFRIRQQQQAAAAGRTDPLTGLGRLGKGSVYADYLAKSGVLNQMNTVTNNSSSSSTQAHINTLNVHTQATDAYGIARDMGAALDRNLQMNNANYGPN